MSSIKEERPWLVPGQLRKARECPEYGRVAVLHLTGDADNDDEKRNAVISYLRYAASMKTHDEALELWETFTEGVYPLLPGAMEAERGDVAFLGKRFLSWFFESGYTVLRQNFFVSFPYEEMVISVPVDLEVMQKNGRKLWMEITHKKSDYSERARIAAKLTSNSIELLCLMAAAEQAGVETDVMVAHLKSKDDTSASKDPVFEKGKGKNITFLQWEPGAAGRLADAMKLPVQASGCADCRFRDICSTEELHEEEEPEEEINLEERFKKNRTIPSDAQKKVIDHREGPMVVIAVAGGGKTKTLTERYLAMVKDGIPAEKILFLTFTRKAAGELEHRLRAVTHTGTPPESYTFHSFFSKLIREYGDDEIDMEHLATSTKRKKLIVQALNESPAVSGLSYEYPRLRHGAYDKLDGWFQRFELEGIGDKVPGFNGDIGALSEVYDRYEELYSEAGYFDYEDIVLRAGALLRDPEILEKVQERWQYIMVDEFQDVNDAIAENLYRIASARQNIVVVGDDDQGIYGFNGGDSRHILEFTGSFPGAECVFMEDNYRSSPQILSCAQSLIGHNAVRYEKTLRARTETDGKTPQIIEGFNGGSGKACDSDKAMTELLRVFRKYEPEDIAVLARKNSTLEKLGAKLSEAGICFQPPRRYLVDTAEFSVLRCFLKLYVLKEACPTSYLYRLLKYAGASASNGNLYEEHFASVHLMPECISDAVLIADDEERVLREKLKDVFLAVSGFENRTTELDCLLDRIDDECCGGLPDVLRLMDEMAAYHDSSDVEVGEKKGCINLVTSHKAKGKEYKCVFVYGIEDYDATEEERRLLYVSMTRAKEYLVLVQTGDEIAPLLREIEGMTAFELDKEV